MTPRIPPKNGFVFTPGNVIRLEFPAQGYVNPLNTSLSFDVSLVVPNPGFVDNDGTTVGAETVVRFQNNVVFYLTVRFNQFFLESDCFMELTLWRILLITSNF